MNEIIFNGKSNYKDLNTILNYFKPQPPAPKIIKDSVIGMNSYYDFSTVASNGEIVYDDRKINCSITYAECSSRSVLMKKYTEILEWLLSGKHDLIYTGESDMKYIAQIEEAPSFDIFAVSGGTLQVTFIAEPYKKGIDFYGNLLWDDIDFELPDYIQDTKFQVSGTKTITLYNPGSHGVTPIVLCDSNMTCTLNGYTTTFTVGNSVDYSFKLQNGANIINIRGNGYIEFNFRKEVL